MAENTSLYVQILSDNEEPSSHTATPLKSAEMCRAIVKKTGHHCKKPIKKDGLCAFHSNRLQQSEKDIETPSSTTSVGTKIMGSAEEASEHVLIKLAKSHVLLSKKKKIERMLSEGPCQAGFIYLFQKERIVSPRTGAMLVKIGRTKRENAQDRIDEWRNKGGLPIHVKTWAVSHNSYAEHIIHLLLSADRVHVESQDKKGSKEIEWFDIELALATKIVQETVDYINAKFPSHITATTTTTRTTFPIKS